MLQINVRTFASDALEDAMRLAQIKALNSFTFSDCLNNLNNIWNDVYNELAKNDDGYYGKTIRINTKLTKLPPCVKSAIKVYSAQSPMDHTRFEYRSADNIDLVTSGTYLIKGNELYCWDAERRPIWLYYIPVAPQLFFTMYNRDPKIINYDEEQDHGFNPVYIDKYNNCDLILMVNNPNYDPDDAQSQEPELIRLNISDWNTDTLRTVKKVILRNRVVSAEYPDEDITDYVLKEKQDDYSEWQLVYVSCDFPYIFCTYQNTGNDEYRSGFYDTARDWTDFNPFDFTGRSSNVEYRKCKWNDKTGLGVTILDHNDIVDGHEVIKELGWTPDTVVTYPAPEMYRYLVARLAEIFSNINESNVMGVQKELSLAKYAFDTFINKNKAAWQRINNVNPCGWEDWL